MLNNTQVVVIPLHTSSLIVCLHSASVCLKGYYFEKKCHSFALSSFRLACWRLWSAETKCCTRQYYARILTIVIIKSVTRHCNDMRMDVRSVNHLGDNIFHCPRSEQAHVHLELILDRAISWDIIEEHFTHVQNLQCFVNTVQSVRREGI